MSQQADGHLLIPSSYDFNRNTVYDYKKKSIDSTNFQGWFKEDMYKSSYSKFHSNDNNVRNSHIPGYGGFIPSNRAESLMAKTFSNTTRDVFHKPEINCNRNSLATTGFNLNREALIDGSKVANSHKYGKTMLTTPNPAWVKQHKEWVSTTKDTYRAPKTMNDMTYRSTQKNLQTKKRFQKTSGWQQNRDFWDGQGWKPNQVLYPKKSTSEYRDRFNPEKDHTYHRTVETDAKPQMKAKEKVYKYNK